MLLKLELVKALVYRSKYLQYRFDVRWQGTFEHDFFARNGMRKLDASCVQSLTLEQYLVVAGLRGLFVQHAFEKLST